MNTNENALSNHKGIILHTVCAFILLVVCFVDFLQNRFTGLQMGILTATNVVPVIFAWIMYKMNEESALIRHVIGMGYGVFYIAICLISTNRMVFIYAFPMLIAVSIFRDSKFSITVSSIIMAIVVVHAVKFCTSEGWSAESISYLEVEFIGTLLLSIYSVICNKFIIAQNDEKMEMIDASNIKTKEMLEKIVAVSNTLADEVTVASEKLEKLEISSQETLNAMTEVQSGTSESADAVQNQLVKTEEISKQIENVSTASVNISDSVARAVDAIHIGRDNIKKLIDQVKASEKAADSAVKEVEELKLSTEKMGSIVELISSVAKQTSMLALNASIEAARAGEAGRGFAVVATEISNLASQTQTATSNINDLIDNLSKEMTEVSEAILKLVENNESQNNSAKDTSASFEQIVESTRVIRTNAGDLSNIVRRLEGANKEIAESVQTISAITEEVNAHTSTTCDVTEDNKKLLTEVQMVVGEMIVNADKLKSM